MGNVNIILIAENEVFSSGLSFYIEVVLKHQLGGVFKSCLDFLKKEQERQTAIVLLDFEVAGKNSFELIKDCIKLDEGLKFIALTNYEEKVYLKKIYDAGFEACVYKQNIYDRLGNAINEVKDNRKFFPYSIEKIINNKIGG